MTIFIDMDGVITDWLTPVCSLCGIDIEDPKSRALLKMGKRLEDFVGSEKVWESIDNRQYVWWEKLEKLPWADRLISFAKKHGDIAFLTSPGNLKKHPVSAANACHGKVFWVKKNYEDIPLILTQDKHLCANDKTLLIDDSIKKINSFQKSGGHAFRWPVQYSILDKDIKIDNVFKNLEKQLAKLNS